MIKTIHFTALASVLLALPATAQFTMYVAPQTSGVNGAQESGFLGARGPGANRYRTLDALPAPSGTPLTSIATAGATTRFRHRDDAGGALTGSYRSFQVTDLPLPGGVTNRGVHSAFGDPTTTDMLEFVFENPIGNWGATFYDLESFIQDPAIVRAYDNSGTMIFEGPVQFPRQEDGENGSNNALNFVGLISDQPNMKTITVTVGNTQAQFTSGNTNNETQHWIGIVDMYEGSSVTDEYTLATTWADNIWLINPGGTFVFELQGRNLNGITITSLDMHFLDPAGTIGSIDVFGSGDDGNTWRPLASGPAVAGGPGLPTPVTLNQGIPVGRNCTYRLALVANGLRHLYTTGGPAWFPSHYDNADLRLQDGYSVNSSVPGPSGNMPRIPNIRLRYSIGGTCPAADQFPIGSGCGGGVAATLASDTPSSPLPANTMRFVFNADDTVNYTLEPQTVLPIGSLSAPIFYSPLSIPSGGRSVGTHGLYAHGKGAVTIGSGVLPQSLSNYGGSVIPALLDGFFCYKSGAAGSSSSEGIRFESGMNGAFEREVITFDLEEANADIDCQFVFDFHPGTDDLAEAWITVIDDNAIPVGSSSRVIGYVPAGQHSAPFQTMPYVNTSMLLLPTEVDNLQLSASIPPVQATSGSTPYQVTSDSIPPTAFLHYGAIGLSNPGLPLSFIGMPGCAQYASIDLIVDVKAFPNAMETWTPLVIPAASYDLTGTQFYLQSYYWGTPTNTAFGSGVAASNGLQCTIGL